MLARFAPLNDDFHLGIPRAARSRQIEHAVGQIIDVPLIMPRRFEHSLDRYLEHTNRHHRELLAAFRARDPKWAASEMTAHLLSARSVAP